MLTLLKCIKRKPFFFQKKQKETLLEILRKCNGFADLEDRDCASLVQKSFEQVNMQYCSGPEMRVTRSSASTSALALLSLLARLLKLLELTKPTCIQQYEDAAFAWIPLNFCKTSMKYSSEFHTMAQ